MQIHFNRIYVIESLQPNEKLTGTDLHNDLLRYQSIVHSDFESILRKIRLIRRIGISYSR